MEIAIPYKLKLDNAANIYPASMSKHYSSLYRMSLTMSEEVDEYILQDALERVSERIPTFRCTLKGGAFWWYLHRVEDTPVVRELKPLRRFRFKDQNGLLYRVSASGCVISLDVFHALTDGFGAITFLLTLAGEYIRKRYGVETGYNNLVLDPADNPSYSEVEDSFKAVFSGRKGELEKNVDAYHIKGTQLAHESVKDCRVVMPMENIKQACSEYGCTVTDFLVSVMLWALQKEHAADPAAERSVLKVSVPVNLRPIYKQRTLRNFSSYVNLGMDVADGEMSFSEIVDFVKAQKEHDLRLENLEPKIAANVELEEMLLVRCLPLFVKHPIIDIINLLHGDRFCSQTMSNLGNVNVPEAMRPYIADVDFILGRQRGNSGACSCAGYNGKLTFHLTRKIAEDSFEQAFLEQLAALGIPTSVTVSNLA
ncbi:MAG: hypothetical protein J5769_02580 [Bacteroidales bacterium]|nr:hypothetical protein [Bacteroidales bacterium]